MTLCGWCGLACNCTDFPWKVNGFIPEKCEKKIQHEIPYLIPLRAVRDKDIDKWIALMDKNKVET